MPTTAKATECPSWCIDVHPEGADEFHNGTPVETPFGYAQISRGTADRPPHIYSSEVWHEDMFTAQQARAYGAVLTGLADELDRINAEQIEG